MFRTEALPRSQSQVLSYLDADVAVLHYLDGDVVLQSCGTSGGSGEGAAQQDVLWFEVAMHDVVPVQHIQAPKHGASDLLHPAEAHALPTGLLQHLRSQHEEHSMYPALWEGV